MKNERDAVNIDLHDDRCVVSMVVGVPRERAWQLYTDGSERTLWFGLDIDAGGRLAATGPDVDPPWTRRQRMQHPMLPGPTEILFELEELDAQTTRIVVTHSGFGDDDLWQGALESAAWGSRETLSDFALYAETGVARFRHISYRSQHGIEGRATTFGLRVVKTASGSFADKLGLVPGDVVLTIGGAAIYGWRELWCLTREHGPGDILPAEWVRDGSLMSAEAPLGSFWPAEQADDD